MTQVATVNDTTYINKEVKEYFINQLGALVVVFADDTRTIYYHN